MARTATLASDSQALQEGQVFLSRASQLAKISQVQRSKSLRTASAWSQLEHANAGPTDNPRASLRVGCQALAGDQQGRCAITPPSGHLLLCLEKKLKGLLVAGLGWQERQRGPIGEPGTLGGHS